MARDHKPVQLKAIDEHSDQPEPVIRLKKPAFHGSEPDHKPIRLTLHGDTSDTSQRLDLPTKEDAQLRSHQPGLEAIIETPLLNPDALEQNWNSETISRHPIPWGWFALIAIAIVCAVAWSLTQVEKAKDKADEIRVETNSSLIDEAKADQEATQLIENIEKSLRGFFNMDSVDDLARYVRQPERVTPLMRQYYAGHRVFSARVKSIVSLRPLTLANRGDFWTTTVALSNGKKHRLLLEIMPTGEARIDWETMVCFQPMQWDDWVAQRPPDKSLDFRVYIERDHLYSHEFADATRWVSYRLTALESVETLFGYAPAKSELAKSLNSLVEQNPKHKTSVILRLSIPQGLQSPRGVVIEKIMSTRWLYVDAPAADD